MTLEIILAIFTSIGSGLMSYAAMRVDIRWIINTLNRHENYHNEHFKNYGAQTNA